MKPVIEGLAFQACILIIHYYFANSFIPDRIRATSPYLVATTGLLAFLPIHAAGLYDKQEIEEKLD